MPRVIITVPDQTPQPYRFQLDRQAVQLGRGSDNDIAINCGSVSVRHAVMERISGGYQIRDLDSTNGTKLDGSRLAIIPLLDGMTVKLGDVAFDFTLTDEEKATLASEKAPASSPIVAEDAAPAEAPKRQAPRQQPVRRPAMQPQFQQPNPIIGFVMTLVFLILAALAFYVGLSIRHKKETNQSLMNSISEKGKVVEKSTTTEPAADSAAADASTPQP
jgi:pSer/pThr/pTyr-binding forkhead associated (FHA) protein